jgi:hypothetical protein
MIPHSYFERMKIYFNGDTAKTWAWFKTPLPALDNLSPLEMIKIGRTVKLLKFIDNKLKGIIR